MLAVGVFSSLQQLWGQVSLFVKSPSAVFLSLGSLCHLEQRQTSEHQGMQPTHVWTQVICSGMCTLRQVVYHTSRTGSAMGEGRTGKSSERRAGNPHRYDAFSEENYWPRYPYQPSLLGMKAAVPDSRGKAQTPFSSCYTECERLQALETPSGNASFRAASSQCGWNTVWWGKALSAVTVAQKHRSI